MLTFGAQPPLNYDKFLSLCRSLIPEEEFGLLKGLPTLETEPGFGVIPPVLRKWFDYQRSLRNELVKIRASRKHIDPAKYIRGDEYSPVAVSRLAIGAHRNPSILEGERMQDQARWQVLSDLSFGHYFDLDFLVIYALKLLILEKWQRINQADPAGMLEDAVSQEGS